MGSQHNQTSGDRNGSLDRSSLGAVGIVTLNPFVYCIWNRDRHLSRSGSSTRHRLAKHTTALTCLQQRFGCTADRTPSTWRHTMSLPIGPCILEARFLCSDRYTVSRSVRWADQDLRHACHFTGEGPTRAPSRMIITATTTHLGSCARAQHRSGSLDMLGTASCIINSTHR